MRGAILTAAALVLALGACGDRKQGLTPVGGDAATPAQRARYVKRLHLDLTGSPPDPATLDAALTRLVAQGNTPAVRAALADELLAGDAYAAQYVSELEARVLAGQTLAAQTALVCVVARNGIPECQACGPAVGDPCADCDCYYVNDALEQRASLEAAAADLAGGATTSTIDRRFAGALAYRFTFGTPEAAAAGMFDDFLGRAIDPDEQLNAAAMVQGAPEFTPTSPAGVLFHRHGSNLNDLVDILFDSEVYREALVNQAFQRYLGRPASAAEGTHFAASIDGEEPDLRPVIRRVVSSQEYFDL